MVHGHIYGYMSDRDGTFDADRDMVGVIGDPYRHLFPTFEHIPFDEQGFELKGPELRVFCTDGLAAQVTDVEMIDLSVEEHIEGDLIVGFVLAEIDVPGIKDGAHDILYTTGDLVGAGVRDGRF